MMELRIITEVCVVFLKSARKKEEHKLFFKHVYRVYFVFTTYRNSNGNHHKGSPLCNLI